MILTQYIDASNLLLHFFSIDLAHIATSICFLNLSNLQLPNPDEKIISKFTLFNAGDSFYNVYNQ